MNTLLLITTIQSWFFSGLILSAKRGKQQSDYILTGWLFVIGLHTLIYYFMHVRGSINVYGAIINAAIPFLQGPFLYLYVDAKINPSKRLNWRELIHLAPFITILLYQLVPNLLFEHSPASSHKVFIGFFEDYNFFGLFFLVSLPLYFSISLWKSRSDTGAGSKNLTWVRLLIVFVIGIWLSSLLSLLIPEIVNHQDQITINSLVFILLTGFVYFISYFGFKENLFTTDIPRIGGDKYAKSKISEAESKSIWSRLQAYMQTEEPYLDSGLDLNQLSVELDVTANKLSQVINSKSGLNFYDYINQYRIEKIKNLMLSEKFEQYSLLGLALEAGFNSKATFNRVFKKFEHCTPSEYKRKLMN